MPRRQAPRASYAPDLVQLDIAALSVAMRNARPPATGQLNQIEQHILFGLKCDRRGVSCGLSDIGTGDLDHDRALRAQVPGFDPSELAAGVAYFGPTFDHDHHFDRIP